MKCPVCSHKEKVEVDTHSDGYADNLVECGHCGALWTYKEVKIIKQELIHGATSAQYVQS